MSSRDKVVYVCEPGIILVQEGYAFLSNSVFILDPLPNNNRTVMGSLIFGGEGGIRTHGTDNRTLDFESSPFDHSGTSPPTGCRFYSFLHLNWHVCE